MTSGRTAGYTWPYFRPSITSKHCDKRLPNAATSNFQTLQSIASNHRNRGLQECKHKDDDVTGGDEDDHDNDRGDELTMMMMIMMMMVMVMVGVMVVVVV